MNCYQHLNSTLHSGKRRYFGLTRDLAAILNSRGVTSRADHTISIAAGIVTSVDSVARVPRLSVQRAVGTQRNAVLGQNVAGEEVTGLVLAVGISKMGPIVVGLSLTGSGTERRVVWTIVEETHTVVGIVGLAILLDVRRIDGSWQVGRGLEVWY
jgi:hypothetical protein